MIGILMEKQRGFAAYTLMPLLVIFVVGTANFYNFMDGINGIAAITGLLGFGLLGRFAVQKFDVIWTDTHPFDGSRIKRDS